MLPVIPEEQTAASPNKSKTKPTPSKKKNEMVNLDTIDINSSNAEGKVSKFKTERTPQNDGLQSKSRSKLFKGPEGVTEVAVGEIRREVQNFELPILKKLKESKEVKAESKEKYKRNECEEKDSKKHYKERKFRRSRSRYEEDSKLLGRKRKSPKRTEREGSLDKFTLNNIAAYKKKPAHSIEIREKRNTSMDDTRKKKGWVCSREPCKSLNFLSRTDCYKCGKPIPTDPTFDLLPMKLIKDKLNHSSLNTKSFYGKGSSKFTSDFKKSYSPGRKFSARTPQHSFKYNFGRSSPMNRSSIIQKEFTRNNNIKVESKEDSFLSSSSSMKQYHILPKPQPIISEFPYPEIEKAISFLKKMKQEDRQKYLDFKKSSF